mgnify:CR=1 FL=1
MFLGGDMTDINKLILITNNSVVEDAFKGKIKLETVETHKDVLIKARDYIYKDYKLVTHPMASSIKPNQTPFRSIIVMPKGNDDNTDDIMMIEEALESYRKFEGEKGATAWYRDQTDNDFKLIDYYLIEDAIPHLTR